jgi:tRNA (guanine37-N1)-methyltransferase
VLHVAVVTLFPEWVQTVIAQGVTGRAAKRELLRLDAVNPRAYTNDVHHTVDDRPYGGGPGMVMKFEPLCAAITEARRLVGPPSKVVYLSPQGRRLDQAGLQYLMSHERLVLVAGRYEGIDERVIEREIDEEWSVGDYVLSGGELAAMVVIDGMARLLPGALGHEASAEQDSFMDGLLDCPHYTRPEVVDGRAVPAVLLEGHHDNIRRWRRQQALGRTALRRPDLLQGRVLDAEAQRLLEAYFAEQQARDGLA